MPLGQHFPNSGDFAWREKALLDKSEEVGNVYLCYDEKERGGFANSRVEKIACRAGGLVLRYDVMASSPEFP